MNARKDLDVDSGFVAGTLVHTKEGLVPIEQIKVGDWVLSKHESGQGEREYKRVTKTFVHDDEKVMAMVYGDRLPEGGFWGGVLFVTGSHPIGVEGKGWIEAQKMLASAKQTKYPLSLLNERAAFPWESVKTYLTRDKHRAWIPRGHSPYALQREGFVFDFEVMDYLYESGSPSEKVERMWHRFNDLAIDIPTWRHQFKTRVYNIEVEDFHTYYVGEHGVWVHNKNPLDQSY